MKPIAQTFYINEPENGVAGVYVTSIDLFFKSKSPIFGIQVQIRQTENGNPTKFIVPHSIKTLPSASVNVSDDASVATNFLFKSPLFLQSQNSYAIVIIPDGGNPDYLIWTAELAPGTLDISTNSPIKTNNDTGTLFISSNDIQFTSVPSEDIKFVIYTAAFKSSQGRAVFRPTNTDYVSGKDKIGNFLIGEYTLVSNSTYSLAKLTMSANTGAFTVGETIFQSNSTVNAFATGKVFSANLSTIKVTNSVGNWVTGQVKGVTSISNATVSAISSNVISTENSNTITVPFTNVFSSGELIYLGKNDRSYMQPLRVRTVVNGTTLQLATVVNFTENDAMFGRIRGDGALHAMIRVADNPDNPNVINVLLNDVTSNTSVSFNNARGRYLIGTVTGASLRITSTYNSTYNTIVPQFAESKPDNTDIVWSFTGVKSDPTKPLDSTPIPLINNVERELYDYTRSLMSRSNEWNSLPLGRQGDSTVYIYSDIFSGNNKISPMIDYASHYATFLSNEIVPESKLRGFQIKVDDNPFEVGDIVKQSNSSGFVRGTGIVDYSTPNLMNITDVDGYFNTDNNLQLSSDSSVNTQITDLSMFSENYNRNYTYASRYISKNVVLADGQDAEDIRVYLTAYRPATTDFLVYARLQNREDPQRVAYKNWSKLEQRSSPALLSSTANKQDFVELEYGFPSTVELFPDSCTCNSTSNSVIVRSTNDINQNDIIYFKDNNSTNFFIAKVQSVDTNNKKTLYLTSIPPFVISNGEFGVIPNLENLQAAFLYSKTGVVRYLSKSSVVYDTYKTFAIKIVPVSDDSSVVPRAKDMRAIALQV